LVKAKTNEAYEVWVAMTKYKSANFSLHPIAIFSHLSSSILRTSYLCRRAFLTEGVQRVAKAMIEVTALIKKKVSVLLHTITVLSTTHSKLLTVQM